MKGKYNFIIGEPNLKRGLSFFIIFILFIFIGFQITGSARSADFTIEQVLGSPFPSSLHTSADGKRIAWVFNLKGVHNIWLAESTEFSPRKLTNFKKDVSDIALVKMNGKKMIFATVSNPIENEIYLIDPYSQKIVAEKKIDRNITILDNMNDRIMLVSSSAVIQFRLEELKIKDSEFIFNTIIDLPDDLKEETLNSTIERLEFPTFDIDPNTGSRRTLHA